MEALTNREKSILAWLYMGLSDKSHSQKTRHQLQDG